MKELIVHPCILNCLTATLAEMSHMALGVS